MDIRRSLFSPNSSVINWDLVKRWSSGHGHGHGEHAEHVPPISPYRKPLIPPNRPLAFLLGGILIAGSLSMSGFFLWPAAPKTIPEHKLDRKKTYEQTSVEAMSVHRTKGREEPTTEQK